MKSFINKFLRRNNKINLLNNIKFQLFICSLLLFVMAHFSFLWLEYEFEYDYKIGDVVEEDILYLNDYVDVDATDAVKALIPYQIEEIYTIDSRIYTESKESIGIFYGRLYDTRAEYTDDPALRLRILKILLSEHYVLTDEELTILSDMNEFELRLSESYIYDVLKEILSERVTEDTFIKHITNLQSYINNVDQLSDEIKPIIIKMATTHIQPNSQVDKEATDQLISERVSEVKDVILEAGTIIATKGDILNQDDYKFLNELGRNNEHTIKQQLPLFSMDVMILIILLIMSVVLHYHYVSRKNKVTKEIFLNFSIVTFVYFVSLGFSSLSVYVLPIATVGMLISILEDATVGIVYSFFLAILYGIVFSQSIEIITFSILGSMVASILVYKVLQRSRILLAGMTVAIVNAVVIACISTIAGMTFKGTIEDMLFGALAGFLCAVLTIGSLPFWEVSFKIMTPIRLMEYANPNHPLMRKLLLEAPGTYHHSILVANLSEAAAHDISANALLARVGSYFHDIGKIERPFLYGENQYDGQNPHDQFVPRVSAKIIKDHVVRGLILGKKYKLPKEIIEFIEQHHGTTLIKYFYHKAKDHVGDSEMDISVYTYEGPKPCSKEVAIVMLADSVEAAVRSNKNADKQSVKELISKIIQGKIKDRQLDQSNLTLHEIEMIKTSFMNTLSSAFHERIEYPELQEEDHQLNEIK